MNKRKQQKHINIYQDTCSSTDETLPKKARVAQVKCMSMWYV